MMRRFVILTEIIAPYRIPVFNALTREDGIDLHVIFLSETDPSLRQWHVYKDEIRFSYEILRSWRRRLGKHNILLNWGLKAALQRAAPDAILCGGYNYIASWKSMLWARRKRVPFLLWVESTGNDLRRGHAPIEFLKRKFIDCAGGFVVPGKSSFDYLRTYGVREENIFTAPNAVDVEFFSRLAEAVRKNAVTSRESLHLPSRFFLFVGRLVREKGVFDLLDAYGTLTPEARAEIGLVFVGEGAARGELQQRASSIRPGTVICTGFTHREQLAQYYALSDMLAFPTYTDTWGLVVNEAMACSLPVIASSAAGCTVDLVKDHWNGRVVRRGDVGQLAAAMNELATNTELRLLMGQRSRQRIAGYSPEACAAGIARAALGNPR